jgi:hypothetical protein
MAILKEKDGALIYATLEIAILVTMDIELTEQ